MPTRTTRSCFSRRDTQGHSAAGRARLPGRAAGNRAPAKAACADTTGIRADLVARARARLAAGFYDLPECLEIALDRMAEGRRLAR